MPIHFESFMDSNDTDKRNNIFSNILTKDIQQPDGVFASEDKKSFHIYKNIIDRDTKQKIGKTTITMKARENANEIVDVDITLDNSIPCKLNFEEKLKESSESNEYYHVSIDEKHFEVETVNHYIMEGKEILNTEQEVYISVFPFQLNVHNNMEEINKIFGFTQPIKVGGMDMTVGGLAEDFIGVGSVVPQKINEPSSLIIGKVKSYKDIIAIIGETEIPMTIIQLETGIGIVPVAASRTQFNLSNLAEGKIIMMFADVKADFQK